MNYLLKILNNYYQLTKEAILMRFLVLYEKYGCVENMNVKK